MGKQGTRNVVQPRAVGIVTRQATAWSGPLPDPASLEAYRNLVADAPERILAMAEEEAVFRRNRTDADHDSENRTREADVEGYHDGIRRGQYLSCFVILACIGGAVFCVLQKANAVAGILAGAGFAGIAAQFIPRRK